MIVAVGSKNPIKVRAVEEAFKIYFPKIKVIDSESDSLVSSMPFGDDEAIAGAMNRARNAIKEHNADFGVGLEGAYRKVSKYGYFESPWFVIIDRKGNIGLSGGGGFLLPTIVVKKLKEGMELGDIMDEITGITNSKQKQGAIGFFTNGVIDRRKYYKNYIIMALSRFLHKDLYDKLT